MMDEIILNITPENFNIWRQMDETREFFAFLNRMRLALAEAQADIPVQSYTVDKIAIETAIFSGKIAVLRELLDMSEIVNATKEKQS